MTEPCGTMADISQYAEELFFTIFTFIGVVFLLY